MGSQFGNFCLSDSKSGHFEETSKFGEVKLSEEKFIIFKVITLQNWLLVISVTKLGYF